MHGSRLWHGVLALAFALGITLAGHSQLSAQPSGAGLQTIRLGYLENNPQWVPTLDPAIAADQNSGFLTELMNAELVNLKQVGSKIVVYADLARSLPSISKDGKTYTFHLRPNARFSDGHRVTAADVVFSLRRALSPKTGSPVAYYDNLIQGFSAYNTGKSSNLGVKALGSSTVQIRLSQRASYFLTAFTYNINYIVEKRVIQGTPTNSTGTYLTTTCKANVGAGPFKPVCNNKSSNDVTSFYRAGSTPTLTLVPNTHYYGHHAHVRLVIPAIDSTQTGYAEFRAGSLDQTFEVPSSDQAAVRGKPYAHQYPGNGIEFLDINLHAKPFSNVHCRLAVDYAIDRATLDKDVLHGAYKPLYTVVPPGFLGYYNGAGTPHYNPAKARKELSECPGGINITYVWRNDTADRRAEAPAIQAMLRAVGIHVNLDGRPRADWLKIVVDNTPLNKTHTDMAYGDWFMDYPDPQDYCYTLLHTGSSENTSGWYNKTYDRMVDQADVTVNTKKRAALFVKAQKYVLSRAGFIPIDNFTNYDLISTRVRGLVPNLALGIAWAKNNDWSLVSKT